MKKNNPKKPACSMETVNPASEIKTSKFFILNQAARDKFGLTDHHILWVIIVFILFFSTIYFRLYPIQWYPTHMSQRIARSAVLTNTLRQVRQFLKVENPKASFQELRRLEHEAMAKIIDKKNHEMKFLIKFQAKEQLERKLREESKNYLLEVDPYYYMDLTNHILRKGRIAEKVNGRTYFNPKMLAPNGAWYPIDLHPYVGANLYRIFSIVFPKISLVTTLSLIPLIISCLCLIPFLLLCSKIFHLRPAACFIASLQLTLTPLFLERSNYGWYDTDPYNILFPILIFLTTCLWITEDKSSKRRVFFFLCSMLAFAVHSLFWRGWMLIYVTFGGALISTFLLNLTRSKDDKPKIKLGLWVLWFILTPIPVTLACFGFLGLKELLGESIAFARNFFHPTFNLWPDIFITVGELHQGSVIKIVRYLGGALTVSLAYLGIALAFIHQYRRGESRVFFLTSLLFFVVCFTTWLGLSFERFILLLVFPIALCLGLSVDRFIKWVDTILIRKFSPNTHGQKSIPDLLRIFSITFLSVLILFRADTAAKVVHTIYNASWDRATTFIKNTTPLESIITAWWCPGHFISSAGQRRVTFDGATQNTPQAYWVAKLFLEDSEKKALGILRMLDTSGNKAYEFLQEKKWSIPKAIETLLQIQPMDKNSADRILTPLLEAKDRQTLLGLTHGDKLPSAYLFIYNNFLEELNLMTFLGRWDFTKAEKVSQMLQTTLSDKSSKILKRGSKENISMCLAIGGNAPAQDKDAFEIARNGDLIYFTNGLELNIKTKETKLFSSQYGDGIPRYLYFAENDRLVRLPLKGANLKISVLLVKNELEGHSEDNQATYRTILAEDWLIESLAFRLFYLKGIGLNYLEPVFNDEDPIYRTKIYIYKVNWETFEKDLRTLA